MVCKSGCRRQGVAAIARGEMTTIILRWRGAVPVRNFIRPTVTSANDRATRWRIELGRSSYPSRPGAVMILVLGVWAFVLSLAKTPSRGQVIDLSALTQSQSQLDDHSPAAPASGPPLPLRRPPPARPREPGFAPAARHPPGISCRERHERDVQEGGGGLRRGELSTTDGPFGETKEQLGGSLLIKAWI